MTGLHDQRMWDILEERPEAGIPWYLMAAYLYYEHDKIILSDGAFDALARFLIENWWLVNDHAHAHFIKMEDLECGTLLMDYRELPLITKSAAGRLYSEL